MFVAWRDLRFAKGRFALMGTVIVLITLLVGLLSGLTAGLGRQNISAITDLPADKIAFGTPGSGEELSYSNSTVTEKQWQQWAEAPGVSSAEPLGITTTKATAGNRSTGVSAFGVEPGSALAPDSTRFSDRATVLSTAAADDLGVTAGDTFTLAGQEVTVAAVSGDVSFSHTPVVWTSLDAWQQVAPPTGKNDGPVATVIALNTSSGTDVKATDEAADTKTVSKDDSLSAIGSYTSENGSLQLMRGFLFAISALVIGAFFTVWTIQRSGDVAVLKALGASTGNLLKDALGQAVILLTGGTLIGTGIAAGLGVLVAGSAVPFLLTPATVLVAAVVMIALGALGAALSIRRITSVDPLTALGSAR
ncbi:ABC transporter substrate-binding protein [Streptomyces agglomeratus]|uniref:ABC transporter permease n=1 Tax=Streptomyces agglomeratus TaxID=285458 RepID=UPI00085258D9|nr:ABC transporter permease [Streptomyces agglomeratus]OEJ36821.1 ABC transporter substrate-binding protein [Streptomyces agglomeratus]OEJ36823.1 ABC transporter substrate-binding protein [Streptomyces agglomeratus]OEJ42009.1 ABC transporter substrate-binding protein [Streptomyces agglomeratus]OEJ43611.1 ABC transporter substrate-binding protein [Streptomyces agglomeratus]OEJ61870.1 ABC transporter substrate-binding protein [Streptomyces agglomeratus]